MSCDELRDHYEMYAMGVADEPERSEIREHLGRGCEVCMAEMKRARTVTAMLGGTAPLAAPSPKLRRRILASVGVEPRRLEWLAPLLAAATVFSLFAAVYFGGRERDIARETERARQALREQTIELTRLNEAFAIMSGPDTAVSSFGAGQQQPPKGKVFINPNFGTLLVASNLPPAPAGKRYEMWVLPKQGNPVPAGLFQSEPNGTAMHVRRGTVDLKSIKGVAVTLENEAGAAQPTSTPVIVAVQGL